MQNRLTVDRGFDKIENFFTNFYVLPNHHRAKFVKNRNFYEISLFSVNVIIILWSTISMFGHILLERTFKTDQSGIYVIEICSYNDEYITNLILPYLSRRQNRLKIRIFYPSSY